MASLLGTMFPSANGLLGLLGGASSEPTPVTDFLQQLITGQAPPQPATFDQRFGNIQGSLPGANVPLPQSRPDIIPPNASPAGPANAGQLTPTMFSGSPLGMGASAQAAAPQATQQASALPSQLPAPPQIHPIYQIMDALGLNGPIGVGQRLERQQAVLNATYQALRANPNINNAQALLATINPALQPELFKGYPGEVKAGSVSYPVVNSTLGGTSGLNPNAFSKFVQFGNNQLATEEGIKAQVPAYQKRFDSINEAGTQASNVMGMLGAAQQLAANPAFISGSLADQRLLWKQFTSTYGGDPNAAAPTEAFKSLLSGLVLNEIKPLLSGTGRVMQAEVNTIQKMIGEIPDTQAGIQTKIQIMQKQAQRTLEVQQLAQQYAQSHGGRIDPGFDAALAQHLQQNPLFSAQELAQLRGGNAPAGTVQPGNYNWTPNGGLVRQ